LAFHAGSAHAVALLDAAIREIDGLLIRAAEDGSVGPMPV
jgi:hypothetical protein